MSGRKIIAYSSPSGAPLTGRTLEMRSVGASLPLVHPFHIANGLYDTGLIAEGLYRLWDITTTPTDTGLYVDVGADTLKENTLPNGSGNHALFGSKEFRRIQIADVEDLTAEVDGINDDISDLQGEVTSAKARLTAVELEADVIPSKFDKAGGTISGFTGLGAGSTPVKFAHFTLRTSTTPGAPVTTEIATISGPLMWDKVIGAYFCYESTSSNGRYFGYRQGHSLFVAVHGSGSENFLTVQTTASDSGSVLGVDVFVTLVYKE